MLMEVLACLCPLSTLLHEARGHTMKSCHDTHFPLGFVINSMKEVRNGKQNKTLLLNRLDYFSLLNFSELAWSSANHDDLVAPVWERKKSSVTSNHCQFWIQGIMRIICITFKEAYLPFLQKRQDFAQKPAFFHSTYAPFPHSVFWAK